MVESLLVSIVHQSRVPDRVNLVLDGYEGIPSPAYPPSLDVIEHRMPTTGGPGGRWRAVKEMPREAVLINFDDDQCLAGADVIETMAKAVENGGAASYMGMTVDGGGGVLGAGTELVSIAAGTLALHVADLDGLEETLAEVREKGGFDAWGVLGDDDAVISAHLWRKGVVMRATGPLALYEAPGAQEGSQFVQRQAVRDGRGMFWQREAIAKIIGWPWRMR